MVSVDMPVVVHPPRDARQGLRCVACGDVIGVYERLLIEGEDGRLHPSSVLNLDEEDELRDARVWHVGCGAL